ncbi:ABC transporter permease [Campylobacter sp. 19-13652]|uniref:ABC transporter permease n=1 Tax=Campylobacter sp. 19-13652 TaxID=2840180 RepID=UPI001C77973D|nr:FtsX-like permease family protein [Campylobacter sp. 19-13652]BCX80004.1 membrane protein [Campylobacter sp. 19-13652]
MTENRLFFINLILKSLKNGSARVAVIAISIMLGASVCAAFINVYLDIDAKVSRELKSYGANLVITPANGGEFMSESGLDKDMKKVIKTVLGYSGYLFTQASIGTTEAIIMGVKFSSLKRTKPFLEIKEGDYINFDFDDKNVLIGTDLAKQSGFKAGDEIELRALGSSDVIKVRIKGIVASGDKEDALLITSLNLAQKLAKKPDMINYADAVILGDFDEVKAISQKLSNKEISAKIIAKISKQEGYVLAKIKLLMALVSFVILLITSLCVNTTLSAILLARSKEIALLRALGASKKNILNLFSAEIFMLAFSFAIIGSLLGYGLAQILGEAIFNAHIDFRFMSVPIATILALGFATLAAIYPLRRALKLNMADILRGE